MKNRENAALNFQTFRRYPTKIGDQSFDNPRNVCHACVSGACCTNQDAIALNAFDILRLAAFFDMSPAQFMLKFTQDEFEGEAADLRRTYWNENPHNSVVTWLRRRGSFAASPCIFLKYARDHDGTPRRICSVHDGRPLSCREYYYSHCKTRGTGELAALLAEGFEKVRDGEITEPMVDAELARLGKRPYSEMSLAKSFQYSFWVEMKCVLNLDQANVEGSNSYNMADYQDPIDEKLNRVISSKYIRFEERYGLKPRDEQLMPYTSGLRFAQSAERERITKLVITPPSLGIFKLQNFPYYISIRTLMPGARAARVFRVIPAAASSSFLRSIPRAVLFPNHDDAAVRKINLRDIYAAVLCAANHLIRYSSHIAALEPIMEFEARGTLERQLLTQIAKLETCLNPFIARNPYLRPVKEHLSAIALNLSEAELSQASIEEVFGCLQRMQPLSRIRASLSKDLRSRIEMTQATILAKLRKGNPLRLLNLSNPIEDRRLGGKTLIGKGAAQAWSEWFWQMLAVRPAGLVGLKSAKMTAFYRQAIKDLEVIPFRRDYGAYLFEAVKYLASSMADDHTIPYTKMDCKESVDRLARYGIDIFSRLEFEKKSINELQTSAEFIVAVYKDLGLSYNHDQNMGQLTYRLLESQLNDGSWGTDPLPADMPETQAHLLERMYHTTCACILSLAPLRNDALHPMNSALGLV